MNQRLSRYLAGFGIMTIAGAATLGHCLFRQLTYIPAHLQREVLTTYPQSHPDWQSPALKTVAKMHESSRNADGAVVIQLSAQDLNDFLGATLACPMGLPYLSSSLKSTNVVISAQTMKTTTLLDLSQVSSLALECDRLFLLRRLLKIPGLNHRQIAIAVEGKPAVKDGIMTFTEPTISIGTFALPFTRASFLLGISDELFQARLDREWRTLPIDINTAQIITTPSDHLDSAVYFLQLEGQLTAW